MLDRILPALYDQVLVFLITHGFLATGSSAPPSNGWGRLHFSLLDCVPRVEQRYPGREEMKIPLITVSLLLLATAANAEMKGMLRDLPQN